MANFVFNNFFVTDRKNTTLGTMVLCTCHHLMDAWLFLHIHLKHFKKLKLMSDNRGKKITCPGARDKLNFRQDKHKFSSNGWRASKKFSASLFFLEYSVSNNTFRTSYMATGQVKIFMYLPRGQVKI